MAECESGFRCCNQGGYQASTEAEREEEKATPWMPIVSTFFSYNYKACLLSFNYAVFWPLYPTVFGIIN